MYSVILTELGISIFNDGQVDKAFPFSNSVKEYLAIKNKEAKFYVKVTQENGHQAWSSPIYIKKN